MQKVCKKCFIDLAGNWKSSTFAPAFERETRMSIEMMGNRVEDERPVKKTF